MTLQNTIDPKGRHSGCRDALYQWNARLLSLEEIPLIKCKGGAAVYRWNAALNRWTECHAVFVDASMANEDPFSRRFTVSSGHF
jgi:hypothetical protein